MLSGSTLAADFAILRFRPVRGFLPLQSAAPIVAKSHPRAHLRPLLALNHVPRAEPLEEAEMQDHGPWKIIRRNEVYRDPWVRVKQDDVLRPDGKPGTYCSIDVKPGVTVLALDAEGYVYLMEEFHYAVGRVTLEASSGGIEPGEDPLLAAQRELQEELGITAARWQPLGVIDPFTANVSSPAALFLAMELTHGATSHEGTESIQPVRLSFAAALDAVMEGRITHAPSCVLLFKAERWLKGQGLL